MADITLTDGIETLHCTITETGSRKVARDQYGFTYVFEPNGWVDQRDREQPAGWRDENDRPVKEVK